MLHCPLPSTPERFEPVTGPRQVAEADGRVELVELARGGPREAGERRAPTAPVECLGPPIGESDDHDASVPAAIAPVPTAAARIRVTSSITGQEHNRPRRRREFRTRALALGVETASHPENGTEVA